jgi:hypothetical protein
MQEIKTKEEFVDLVFQTVKGALKEGGSSSPAERLLTGMREGINAIKAMNNSVMAHTKDPKAKQAAREDNAELNAIIDELDISPDKLAKASEEHAEQLTHAAEHLDDLMGAGTTKAEFEEEKHPRGPGGEWTSGSGSSGGTSSDSGDKKPEGEHQGMSTGKKALIIGGAVAVGVAALLAARLIPGGSIIASKITQLGAAAAKRLSPGVKIAQSKSASAMRQEKNYEQMKRLKDKALRGKEIEAAAAARAGKNLEGQGKNLDKLRGVVDRARGKSDETDSTWTTVFGEA